MVPYNWNDYNSYGTIITSINTICFKVPCDNTEWNIEKLLEKFPNIKIIIDLRYSVGCYNPNYVEKLGIKYIKIPIKGQNLPSNKNINKFFNVLDNSIKDNKLVGVHCVHGVNRTGYMICKYMMYKFNITAYIAIKIFETHRKHNINRNIYITNL
ncbi:protein tyrosine phosphatase 1 [Mythimna separata entomopoxvirus 'L']|uniref:Protein tyrosine phosphatase 1 n=1 Tax=Mythimna separata entomopoxvirus 'L' TaxID=1293572 RepID=A0A916NYT1_9POXV|nr:protein tyrosine phosphatase 1 [Mythimna separata entomopoxvirus 'L']CCU56469.1 protein tyrosine phosphatase 1 [Mythimna separata entomopoxvirus 'L']